MSDGYTPTTDEIRDAWWRDQCAKPDLDFDDIYNAAFDRWLEAHDAEVRAEQEETTEEWVMYAILLPGGLVLPEYRGKNYSTHHRVAKAGPWLPNEWNNE